MRMVNGRPMYRFTDEKRRQFPFLLQRGHLTHDFQEHTHGFHEIAVITGGTATHRVDGRDRFTKAGDVFVFSGEHSHAFIAPHDLTLWNVSFDPSLISSAHAPLKRLAGYHALFLIGPTAKHELPAFRLSARGRLWFERHVARMHDEYAHARPGFEAVLTAYLIELTAYLSRSFSARTDDGTGVFAAAAAASHIEEHFRSVITPRALAEVSGVTDRHVRRLFLTHYGMNPTDYQLRLRVHAAAQELAESDDAVTAIAFRCGFTDSNYFSRCFRSVFGISPRDYRAKGRAASGAPR